MTAPVPNRKIKTFTIDFDLYTDGDPSFKNELIRMMMENIKELLQAYEAAIAGNSINIFRICCHKVLSTLNIIGDKELISIIEKLKDQNDPSTPQHATMFRGLCDNILENLTSELSDELI